MVFLLWALQTPWDLDLKKGPLVLLLVKARINEVIWLFLGFFAFSFANCHDL